MSLVLDNEALQALMDPRHPKHAQAVAHATVTITHDRPLMVPATVMVEAEWDRGSQRSAVLNRLAPEVDPLDEPRSRQCVRLAQVRRVGVVDAHVAALANAQTAPVTVLTSDLDDMEALTDRHVKVVRI